MRAWFVAATLVLAPAVAFGGTREGVKMKDKVKVGGKKLVLNGMGIRQATVFNVNVYVAGLYLEAKTRDANDVVADKAKHIELHFVRDVDLDDLQDAFTEGFEKNGGSSLGEKVKALNGMMADMEDGQRMSLSYVPGKGTTVKVKGKKKGVVEGADFAKVLFTIFVGPKAPNRLLRDGMLGKA
jgi:hypothetical protein